MKDCEVCGRPAMWHVNDLRQEGVYTGANGDTWPRMVVASSHTFCGEHVRESRTVVDCAVCKRDAGRHQWWCSRAA